jgi:multidrug resistance efflux pump
VITPYQSLRPATATAATTATNKKAAQVQQPQQQQGQGRGGRGGGNQPQERTGSTRILWLVPEGTEVQEGEVVCILDSAAFRTELAAQQIRFFQAKSWVEQVERALEVAEVSLREYRDGIYPKDLLLTKQYIETCNVQLQGARDTYAQALKIHARGLLGPEQLQAEKTLMERAEINLRQAHGMQVRLEKFTAPRLLKNLEAKIASIRTDLYAQQAAFELERQRKERLEKNIANCTLQAPRSGVVSYALPPNSQGRSDLRIAEGVPVRQRQAIINIPDSENMQVRAKINESKVKFVHAGQRAQVRVDAFPGRVLGATVVEVTPISTKALGQDSDVKCYIALVTLDSGGFPGLRHGMSAQIDFLLEGRTNVTRIPLDAIRWVGGTAYAAVPVEKDRIAWRKLELGLLNPYYAEVRSGLAPGETVVVRPDALRGSPPGPPKG